VGAARGGAGARRRRLLRGPLAGLLVGNALVNGAADALWGAWSAVSGTSGVGKPVERTWRPWNMSAR